MYGCNYNMGIDTAYSKQIVVAKQFFSSELLNNFVANQSWFTDLDREDIALMAGVDGGFGAVSERVPKDNIQVIGATGQ